MKTILAIDPGASGGFALDFYGVQSIPMPDTEGDIVSYLQNAMHCIKQSDFECTAYIEEVGGFIGKAQPGSAMFKFGRNFGFILGCLQSLGYRVELVRPQKWQKHFSLGTKSQCESATVWKNKLKSRAQQLYPQLKVTLQTADALLLLEYAKHQTKGNQ